MKIFTEKRVKFTERSVQNEKSEDLCGSNVYRLIYESILLPYLSEIAKSYDNIRVHTYTGTCNL